MSRTLLLVLAGIDLFGFVIPAGALYIHYVNAPHPERVNEEQS